MIGLYYHALSQANFLMQCLLQGRTRRRGTEASLGTSLWPTHLSCPGSVLLSRVLVQSASVYLLGSGRSQSRGHWLHRLSQLLELM